MANADDLRKEADEVEDASADRAQKLREAADKQDEADEAKKRAENAGKPETPWYA